MSHGFTTAGFIRGLQRARVPAAPLGYEHNLTAANRDGTTVAGHATVANSAGNFVEIFPSTVNNARGVWVMAWDGANSINAINAASLISLATGGAGSETIVIPDMDFGGTYPQGSSPRGSGKVYHFPGINIVAGSRVSLQVRSAVAGRSYLCVVALDPLLTTDVSESTVVAYGADQANSRGTSVTPGSGAFGSWVEIGTTSRAHSVWSVGYDTLGDASIVAASSVLVEIAYGPNSGSLTHLGLFRLSQDILENISPSFPPVVYSSQIPTSTKVWARIASNETEARGIIIYGV